MTSFEKFRTVLVGCGSMSAAWLEAVRAMPEVEMVGFVDVIEEAARKRAAEHGAANATIGSDLAAVLSQTSPDVVFNCTIPEAHYPVTMQALAAGCHVLSEKPLADSLEHAREMTQKAKQVGKSFVVIQNRRYNSHIRRMRQFLASNVLGPLTTIHSDFFIGAHFGGFRDTLPHVLLLDMAIHTFDAVRFLSGAEPVSVYCQEWNPQGSWYAQDASAVALFTMTNGLVYTYRGSWCAEGLPTSWESSWRFIGPQGSALWDGEEQMQVNVVKKTGSFISEFQTLEVPAYGGQDDISGHSSIIREFFTCLQQGTQPETHAENNLGSLAMVFGAIESAETGRPVPLHL